MRTLFLVGWMILMGAAAHAQLTPDQQRVVDASVRAEMQATQVPGISLAILRDGKIAYTHAYGVASISPSRPATGQTRFAIGSISKQFTAAAVLLLAEQGKLSLDDPIAKYLPKLTAASDIRIRDVLGHTSGYQDYFTQEYLPAEAQRATTVDEILKTAQMPLEFDPGSQWGYSGTNYVIAARIVEIASGEPFFVFLQKNILRPAGIMDAVLADEPAASPLDAAGYLRFALGPARPAPHTGRNWLFGMAGLSMTAEDVARWDLSVINRTLLRAASYDLMAAEGRLRDGRATGYGLGVMLREVTTNRGARLTVLQHPGEISGFRSSNYIVPQVGTALVILTNAEYSDATQHLARRLQAILGFAAPMRRPSAEQGDSSAPAAARARHLLEALAHGELDRTQLTPEASAVFTSQALEDIRDSIAGLGRLMGVRLVSQEVRGAAHHYALAASYEFGGLDIAEYDTADSRIQQFFLDAAQQ